MEIWEVTGIISEEEFFEISNLPHNKTMILVIYLKHDWFITVGIHEIFLYRLKLLYIKVNHISI